MSFQKYEIITLEDSREFQIVNLVNINDIEFLYLKNMDKDQYTIVKVIENKIFNLTREEIPLVIANLFRDRWSY